MSIQQLKKWEPLLYKSMEEMGVGGASAVADTHKVSAEKEENRGSQRMADEPI